MKSDNRRENLRDPNISMLSLIHKNFKDILAFLLVITCILTFIFSKEVRESNTVVTILASVISAGIGFIFGRKQS